MGVNIKIACDGWDEFANGGMKTILFSADSFPKIYRRRPGDDDAFRPSDFQLWRKSIVEMNCNVEMWLRGLDALEANPELWAEYSY